MTWELVLFLVAAIHGLMLSFIFLFNHSNYRKVFLGLYLLFFSITILHYLNFWSRAVNLHVLLLWVAIISSWLMPVALYYYMLQNSDLKQLWKHLIAPAVFTIYWIAVSIFPPPLWTYTYSGPGLALAKVLVYVIYGWKMMRIPEMDKGDKLFLWPYGAFILSIIIYQAMMMTSTYTLRMDYLTCAAFIVLTYAITYLKEFQFLRVSLKPSYASSSLTEEEGKELTKKVELKLSESGLYRDQELSLAKCAEHLQIPKYRISQALNVYGDQSFTQVVNTLRVEEAKRLLKDRSLAHFKIEAIGTQVGFKNKVSFHQNFSKLVGMTPGQYRDKGWPE